jgi:hypothetical protein
MIHINISTKCLDLYGHSQVDIRSDVRWKIFRNIFPENFPFIKIIT